MKQLLTILFLFISIVSFSQDYTGYTDSDSIKFGIDGTTQTTAFTVDTTNSIIVDTVPTMINDSLARIIDSLSNHRTDLIRKDALQDSLRPTLTLDTVLQDSSFSTYAEIDTLHGDTAFINVDTSGYSYNSGKLQGIDTTYIKSVISDSNFLKISGDTILPKLTYKQKTTDTLFLETDSSIYEVIEARGGGGSGTLTTNGVQSKGVPFFDSDTTKLKSDSTDFNYSNDSLYVKLLGAQRINVDSIGIGTSEPEARLDINGGTGSFSEGLSLGGNTGFYRYDANTLRFRVNGGERLAFNNSAIFGILGDFYIYLQRTQSATLPMYGFKSDGNSGFNQRANDEFTIIAGGVTAINVVESSSEISTGFDIADPLTKVHVNMQKTNTTPTDYEGILITNDNGTTNNGVKYGAGQSSTDESLSALLAFQNTDQTVLSEDIELKLYTLDDGAQKLTAHWDSDSTKWYIDAVKKMWLDNLGLHVDTLFLGLTTAKLYSENDTAVTTNSVRIGAKTGGSNNGHIIIESADQPSIFFKSGTTTEAQLSYDAGSSPILNFDLTDDMQFRDGIAGEGTLLYMDQSAVRIGINKSSPNYTLDVDGDIHSADTVRATAFKFNTPDTNYYTIRAAAFIPRNPYEDTVTITSSITADMDGINFYASVSLPDNATVLEVVVYGNAGASAETYTLARFPVDGFSQTNMASDNINTIDSSISSALIDNENYSYSFITSTLDNGDAIYSARIKYIITELSN